MAKKKSNPAPTSSESMMKSLFEYLQGLNLTSPRDVDAAMRQLQESGGIIPETPPRSALDRAQELIFDAWELPRKADRVKLARKALEISPDCADAYVILAYESVQTLAEMRAFFEQGVAAGQRALGKNFKEYKGHFWGMIETRPYMRARLGLATVLWDMGEGQAAADHMSAMLALNPIDNQGVRDQYITLLLEYPDEKKLDKLLAQYPAADGAFWLYGLALHEFRRAGRTAKADRLLAAAIEFNPHVPAYVLGTAKPPRSLPDYYSPGDTSEAVLYMEDAAFAWDTINGAKAWLSDVMKSRPAPKSADNAARGRPKKGPKR